MPRSDFEARWMKFASVKELVFLGDDVIAMASGVHVMFLNLVTREEKIERFDSAERGRGASCLAGHPVVPMFAIAERRSRPKVFVFTYPGVQRVSSCSLEKRPNGYLSSSFAGTDYLLTLTDFPNFQIILWQWKTGEWLTSIDTKIIDSDQRIACSPSSPYLVSQIGKESGKLLIYEISVCSKVVSIAPTNGATSLPTKIVCSSWTSDGSLVHCDSTGKVSLTSSDGKRCYLIVRAQDDAPAAKKIPLLETFRTGLILVNKKSQIVFYRKPTGSSRVKSGSPWQSVWSVQATSHPTCLVRCPHRDGLLLYGDGGEIFELSIDGEDDSPTFRILYYIGSKYEFLAPVNPLGGHVVAVDGCEHFDVLHSVTGQLVSNMCLKAYGQVRCVASHPTLPIIAIGTAVGKCVILNLVNIFEPSIIRIAYLQRESLERIRYSWSGGILAAANIRQAKLFLIGDSEEQQNSVLGLLHLPLAIIDFLIYETGKETSKILVLLKTSRTGVCGQKIIIYSFNCDTKIEECECVVELPNLLDSLSYGRSKVEVIVIPYLTKQLHFIQIQQDFRGLNVTEAISSGHQLRNIGISVSSNFITTCSYDGLTIVRSKTNIQQVLSIFISHHRQEGGTKSTILSNSDGIFVCLGRNGDLVAMKICHLEVASSAPDGVDPPITSQESIELVIDDDITWVERCLALNLQKEQEDSATERNSILQDFLNLQERLKRLLDTNAKRSAPARLPISNFDLDHTTRSKKIHHNLTKQKNLLSTLEEEIIQRGRVAKYLRELCWDSMETSGCSLLSIDGSTTVDNFPITRVSKAQQDRHQWETFNLDFHHQTHKKKVPLRDLPENLPITGTTTQRWIPQVPISIGNQIKKSSSYTEGRRLCTLIRDQERRLKVHFNKLFEDMRAVKEQELRTAAQRINEIARCSSELKSMFNIDRPKSDDTLQPLWHYSEHPETILDVTDQEIAAGRPATFLQREDRLESVTKLENQSLRLSDDFREGALEIMMDGLLEVRWEDDIKKDPPKPLCLLDKDPTCYTEEEATAVQTYRTKCHELKVQREKYRKLLEDKISSVQEALREDANAFDRKIAGLCVERMKIESAVFQETLMRLREARRHALRRRGMLMTRLAREEVEAMTKELRNVVEVIGSFETVINETKNRYELLTKRDKLLEGKFRGEFPELKQPMVEHLLRQYRKRPRNLQLTCTSVTYLTEAARCLISGEKSEVLPKDCLDFLRGMDSLDGMPHNLPAQIDSSHWQLLCKLRRLKVELEIKIKSCAVDLAEAEQTYASHQKSCTNLEARLSQLKETTRERETEHRRALEDREVQLVIKMGQIESRLSGDPDELSNAVLVPFHVVERANKEIIAAGRNKISAMRKTIVFRRTTLWREWRHECMKIMLRDMKEELKLLQGVKVTKEVQRYVRSYSQSLEAEKEAKIFERMVTATKERFHRMLRDEKGQLNEASHRVTAWRKQNKRLVDAIEKTKLSSFKASAVVHNGTRERDLRYRRIKLKAIMKRTRLAKKIQDNYGELVGLQTQLELLRLKTYPTLRLKGLADCKPTTNKKE